MQDCQQLSGPDALAHALSSTSSFAAQHRSARAEAQEQQPVVGRIAVQSALGPAYSASQAEPAPPLQHADAGHAVDLLGRPDTGAEQQLLRFVQHLRRQLLGSCCAAMVSVAPGVTGMCVFCSSKHAR